MSAPYMPLFVADYLADTAHLNAAENGAYLLLIMNYWQRGKPLPADDRKLARIARMSDSDWSDARETIAEFFVEEDGAWIHKRIEAELAIVEEKSAKAKASARASAESRKTKAAQPEMDAGASVERSLSGRSTDAELLGKDREDTTSEASASSVSERDARPPPAKKGARIPDDFRFDEETRAVGREEGLSDEHIDREERKFCDHFRGAPGERGRKLDWQATARNWLRKAAESFGGSRKPQPRGSGSQADSLLGAYQRAAGRFRETDDDPERGADVFGRHPH